MDGKVLAVLHFASLVAAMVGFVGFFAIVIPMMHEIDPRRRELSNFIPLLVLFQSTYTPAGQQMYRKATARLLILGAGGLGLIVTTALG